jgi:threonine dehydrogenase-like Zn-dependent dehydrogenase
MAGGGTGRQLGPARTEQGVAVRAALLTQPHEIELVDRPLQAASAGQVTIRIEQCGVCASDLELWEGRGQEPFPVAIGHEVAGTIAQLGPGVSGLTVGDRVAAWVEGGGFAEAITVAADMCVPVDAEVAYPAVAEPLACVVNAIELAAPALGDDVAIVGAGYMGNLLQLVSQHKGPRSITVLDRRIDALERARHLTSATVVDTRDRSPREVSAQLAPADVTYEVTGTQAGLELAAALTRMDGKLCIVGYHLGGTRQVDLARWNWMAFQLVNAHFRDLNTIMRGMRAGLRLVNAGALDVDALVTDRLTLDRITDAFQLAAEKPEGFCKAVIVP